MKTEILRSNDELTAIAGEWNQLWESSQCTRASSRAESLVNFNETFTPTARPCFVVVRDGANQMVAGLPVNIVRRPAWIRSAEFPGNEWSQCGRILVDQGCEGTEVTTALIDAIRQIRVGNVWMDWMNLEVPQLNLLAHGARQAGWSVQMKERFVVGVTRLPNSWEDYEQSFSKNSRRKLRTELKAMQKLGDVQLEIHQSIAKDELHKLIDAAIKIEMQSWKGADGTAMGCDPKITGFFHRWAEAANAAGLLRLFFLKLDGQRIAFDLGAVSHGVYASQKISYLPEFARSSPGHVLNGLVNRHFIETGSADSIDTVGPMNAANQRWSNDSYRCGRLVMAPGSWLSNTTGRSVVTLLNAKSAMRGTGDAIESV